MLNKLLFLKNSIVTKDHNVIMSFCVAELTKILQQLISLIILFNVYQYLAGTLDV